MIIEHTRVNKTVYAILASLAVCGIIMASVFLGFNIKYRNQRYIKMSSPQLNNLIIIGCMLTYTSIVFLGLDSGLSSIGTLIMDILSKENDWTMTSFRSFPLHLYGESLDVDGGFLSGIRGDVQQDVAGSFHFY